jgi:hypothetical protein
VTARLVVLVPLPVSVLCGLMVTSVLPQWSRANEAAAVGEDVGRLSALVELHGAVETAHALASFHARAGELGASPNNVRDLVDVDLQLEGEQAHQAAEQALTALGASAPVDAESGGSSSTGSRASRR